MYETKGGETGLCTHTMGYNAAVLQVTTKNDKDCGVGFVEGFWILRFICFFCVWQGGRKRLQEGYFVQGKCMKGGGRHHIYTHIYIYSVIMLLPKLLGRTLAIACPGCFHSLGGLQCHGPSRKLQQP